MSPDLGDMWHHGYLVSPQWEGELKVDSAKDSDSTMVGGGGTMRNKIENLPLSGSSS